MMGRFQLCNVLLRNLEYLILQTQIEGGGDDQARACKIGVLNMQGRRQFVDCIVGEVDGEVALKLASMQEAGPAGLKESSTLLGGGDIALQGHLKEHLLHTLERSFGMQKWVACAWG